MTRKKRQQASERMKQIWAQRKAKEGNGAFLAITPPDELAIIAEIIVHMNKLSPAGKQYLVNRFM